LLEAEPIERKTPQFLATMMSAAINKDESLAVVALLRHGAFVDATLASGATPLDAAVFAGASKVVSVLLNSKADPNKISRDGTSPLEDASLKGLDAIAEMLLDHGALVNQVNNASGTTALYAAASFGRGDVARLLLKRGADPNLCGTGHASPYEAAVKNGYVAIATDIQRYGGSKRCKPEPAGVE
jgi:ankyrin repeat protein